MEHRDARTLLSQVLDEGLVPDQERDLALHLVQCEDCKSAYDTLHRASSAFRRMSPRDPDPEVVEAAAVRAAAVRAGEADPGAVVLVDDTAELFDVEQNGLQRAQTDETTEELGAFAEPVGTRPEEELTVPLDDIEIPSEEPLKDVEGPRPEDIEIPSEEPFKDVEARPSEDVEAPPEEPSEDIGPLPPMVVDDLAAELEEATDHAPSRADELEVPAPEPPPGEYYPASRPTRTRIRVGPTILAVAATLTIAVVVGLIIAGGPGDVDGDQVAALPPAENVQRGVDAVFDDLRSLKTSFSVSRLSLYRLEQDEERVIYSFSAGTFSGRVLYEEPERLREEVTLEVQGEEFERRTTVRTPEEVRTLTSSPAGERITIEANAPLGPPNGRLLPDLGVLEASVGSAARLLVDAGDLEVVERTQYGERVALRVRFSVAPSEFTRADRMEVLLDEQTHFPLHVRRTLDRTEARVLGPSELLSADAIDSAYGDRQRITTETVDLESVVLDDVILPGEFILDTPEGVEQELHDGRFERVSLAELEERLPFTPLEPHNLPPGFRHQTFATHTGEPQPWGPEGVYPAPSGILQSTYSDGKTTIVLTQMGFPDGPFDIERSPLAEQGLPLTETNIVRAGRQFIHAISPELAPHLYGFVDGVLVFVSGHSPQDDLLRIAASLERPEIDEDQDPEDP